MAEYIYRQAPVYLIDGVPGYKAGEWPGLKSNKFENTRRIIHPKTTGIIFNENEPPLKPRRKLLDPGYSKEMLWKSCVKMVKQVHEKKKVKKTAFELFPAMTEGRRFIQKKCIFEQRNDYYKTMMDKHNKMTMENAICNKGNKTMTSGFNKQFFENVSNNKLLGVTITKDIFNSVMRKSSSLPKITTNEFIKSSKMEWKQRELKKISNIKMEQENLQRDINYVSQLKENENNSDEDLN